MSKLKKYVNRIGSPIKVMTEADMLNKHWKKEIFDNDTSDILLWKLVNHFNIGDKIAIYGTESKWFNWRSNPISVPEDVECSFIGARDGYYIMYPKGWLVTLKLKNANLTGMVFHSEIAVDNKGKYFYNIWRSR